MVSFPHASERGWSRGIPLVTSCQLSIKPFEFDDQERYWGEKEENDFTKFVIDSSLKSVHCAMHMHSVFLISQWCCKSESVFVRHAEILR